MATPFPIPVTAAQVGTYFVGQYYHVLQQQPEFVHQFYSDASTMLRIDGNTRETAAGMLQMHALIMSLNFNAIEIKTAHSLESWNGGVLVMVSGSMQIKDFSVRRRFMQTFFLAPQEKGYFVLNDIFHFNDDEPVHHHPAVLLAQGNLDPKRNASAAIPEPVSNYLLGGEIPGREFVACADVKENGPVDNYNLPEQPLQQPLESENIVENNCADETNGSVTNTVNAIQDYLLASVEESVGERQKHTYASILRVAKGQSAPAAAEQPLNDKNNLPASEWNHPSQPVNQQQLVSSTIAERSVAETEEVSAIEDEGEIKSVYVRNLPSTVSESEIEEEFKKFGEIRPDGVVIRSRKDVGVCYAFVEFEDMSSVHIAVKWDWTRIIELRHLIDWEHMAIAAKLQAGSAQVAGRQVYIEERRPNSNIPLRGGRGRGRGRGGYQSEATRGRFSGRSFGRLSIQDGGEREYNRPRGNGFYRPGPRQDRGFSGHQISRSGQNSVE